LFAGCRAGSDGRRRAAQRRRREKKRDREHVTVSKHPVAVDGSPPAQRALDDAIELARSTGASLTLATVAPELSGWFLEGAAVPPPVNPGSGVPLPTEPVRARLIDEHRQILERARGRVPDGVQTSTVLLKGRVGEAIVRQIRAAGHDLVAMCWSSPRKTGRRSPMAVMATRERTRQTDEDLLPLTGERAIKALAKNDRIWLMARAA
jgi:nucleotide-binding universal stress UspA family protein